MKAFFRVKNVIFHIFLIEIKIHVFVLIAVPRKVRCPYYGAPFLNNVPAVRLSNRCVP